MSRPGEPSPAARRGPRSVLVIAAQFPSPIQPWLLNQIDQVYRHGGTVQIVAEKSGGDTYPARVDELGLLERTHHLPCSRPMHLLRGLGRLVAPVGGSGRAARAGVRRLLASSWRPAGIRHWLRTLARAPAMALNGYDLVHAHSVRYAWQHHHLARVSGAPMILTFHGQTPRGVEMLAASRRRELFDAIDAALVNTEFARRQLEAIGGPADRIHVLPQGIRLSDHPFRPRPFPDGAPIRLLSVCRLQRDKGLRFAIRAVRRLRERGYDVEYDIVGGGPEAAELRKLVRSLELEDVVRLAGRVDEDMLRDHYREAHVFILPSVAAPDLDDHTETQGVVLQEAQASGVIVTASRVGGIPECVDNGGSAFLFDERDPGAIARAVAHVVDHPERWPEWQRTGLAWVRERFDIDRIGDRLWELYARILAERGAP